MIRELNFMKAFFIAVDLASIVTLILKVRNCNELLAIYS